jgi:hypothetical protein
LGHFLFANQKEALTGEIHLVEDDPQAVRMMLHYLYHLDYPHVSLHCDPTDNQEVIVENAVPIENGIGEPSKIAEPECPSEMIVDQPGEPIEPNDFFWGSVGTSKLAKKRAAKKKKNMPKPRPETPEIPNLVIHATVYSLAEKYMINGLKTVAKQKFADEVDKFWDREDFLQAAEIAYTGTPDDDRGLRAYVVDAFTQHNRDFFQSNKAASVKEVFNRIDNLAFDVVAAMT